MKLPFGTSGKELEVRVHGKVKSERIQSIVIFSNCQWITGDKTDISNETKFGGIVSLI